MHVNEDRLALVTGTSSGIGAAVAKELVQRGWQVVGVARRAAKIDGDGYQHLALDLAAVPSAAAAIERDFGRRLDERAWRRVSLVNNAAIGLAGRVQRLDAEELLRSYALNAVMPLWLMGFVVGRAKAPVRVVNVSSGAAVRAFPGLAAYCASKAALRMAGMSVAEEVERDLHILSYAPGVVDTEMQLATRSKSLEEFPWGETFRRFHAEGRLVSPELPAADIVKFLEAEGGERFVEARRGA
jgi:NAD(P)-dependent dehydrogenase (short-subunit alcohol dehydrogenase family)